jgi:hypothetical protein
MPKGRVISKHYKKMEENTISKLGGWTLHSLSHAGRLALARHVLLALPVYQMGAHSLPHITLNKLVSEIRRFFWGKTHSTHYLAYIS